MRHRHVVLRFALLMSIAVPLGAGCAESIVEGGAEQGGAGQQPAPISSGGGKGDVWGDDDRGESYEVAEGTLEHTLARASAILADGPAFFEVVADDGQSSWYALNPSVRTLAQEYGLCEDEAFADQPVAGFCSATLVAPDLVLTSGHCLGSQGATAAEASCGLGYRIVFGFGYGSPTDDPFGAFDHVPKDDVYRCKEVEAFGFTARPENQDWAIIRLDRPVVGRQPVALLADPPPTDTPILQIGHPSGIPQKLVPGVVTNRSDFYGASLYEGNSFTYTSDLLGGNSGGGVFDVWTGALAGMATFNSGKDYLDDAERQCKVVGVCGENASCRFPPGAFATHKLLEHLAEVKPELLDELVAVPSLVPEAGTGSEADAGAADAGSQADVGGADAGM